METDPLLVQLHPLQLSPMSLIGRLVASPLPKVETALQQPPQLSNI